MKILINAIGSAGDINPFLLIAARLKQQGHQVEFIANPYFEKKIVSLGLHMLPLGTIEQYYAMLNHPDVWKIEKAFALVWQSTIEAARITYRIIESEQAAGETLLIGSTLAVGARLAQEKLGLPLATIHLSPALLLSSFDTPQSLSQPLPEWLPQSFKAAYMNGFERLILDPICKPQLNKFRAELNLPALKSKIFTKWLHSPELVICAFPDWFASVQPDWPPNSINTDFPLFTSKFDSSMISLGTQDSAAKLSAPASSVNQNEQTLETGLSSQISPQSNDYCAEELEQFLAAGAPPVVLTAGTAMAFAKPFFDMSLKAVRAAGKRAILVCDFEDQIDRTRHQDVLHLRYANFESLFKRALLVVHHGGIGTSAMAVYCGKPQIISPFAHDQFDNAMRLEKCGIAKMIRHKDNLKEWINAMESQLSPSALKKVSDYQTKMGDEARGVDLIVEAINFKFKLHQYRQ